MHRARSRLPRKDHAAVLSIVVKDMQDLEKTVIFLMPRTTSWAYLSEELVHCDQILIQF